MITYTLYHNPRCSKSRQTLSLLEQHGITPNIVLYLKTPPSPAILASCLTALGLSPRALLRTQEEAYTTLNLASEQCTDAQLLQAMSDNPALIERPIVMKQTGDSCQAILGRPPENVLQLLSQ
ncbi:arsenate reductase (glutaredoxin) [Marinagarivorans algicola]|uniref:arsenate reductase (glutaredoxin) n=1 Tax=Marinagarivorans algicola TaxID=1513270 RepID=UPI0006B67FFF|nr:arsenate reductase (glutaredoxin) [Marinagarivorans algicola]